MTLLKMMARWYQEPRHAVPQERRRAVDRLAAGRRAAKARAKRTGKRVWSAVRGL